MNTSVRYAYFSIFFFFASLILFIIIVKINPPLWSMFDLQTYYIAGHDVISGRNIYLSGHTYFDFVYTPFAALLFSLIAFLPLTAFKFFMTIFSIVALIISVWVSLGLLSHKQNENRLSIVLLASGVLLWMEPVLQTVSFGQINLIIMALVMLGFSRLDNKYWCGIFIGLATSIKLTPAIFIVYLFLTHRTKAGILATLTVATTIILGFLIIPPSSHLYWSGLFADSSRIGDVRLIGDQSLNGMFSRLLGDITAAKPFWIIASSLVGFSGLSLATYASSKKKELLGILLCAITGLLISPLSWSHHWVWFSLMMIYLIDQSYPSPLFKWIVIAILFIILGWFTPLIPNLSSLPHIIAYKPPKFHNILFIQQNPYILIGMMFLITSAYSLMKHKTETKL